MQYLFCVECKIAKDRMMVFGGNSYCIDCLKLKQPPILTEKEEGAMKKRDDDLLKGLSELFG